MWDSAHGPIDVILKLASLVDDLEKLLKRTKRI